MPEMHVDNMSESEFSVWSRKWWVPRRPNGTVWSGQVVGRSEEARKIQGD